MQKKILYLFAVFACAFFFIGKDACGCTVDRPKNYQLFPYRGPFQDISDSISNAIRDGHFRSDDFERLDFSKPGDPAYGDDAEFEVFNPFGPFGAQRIPDWSQVPEMFTKDSKTVFILRRNLQKPGDGPAIRDSLIAVITHLNKEACQKYKRPKNPDIQLPAPLDLTPVNLTPDNNLLPATEAHNQCVVDANGIWYYLEGIASRHKPAEEAPWDANYGIKCTLGEAQAGKYCPGFYLGWQAKPTVAKDPGELNIARFKRRPPPTAEDYAWKAAGIAVMSSLYLMVGAWVLSLFHALGRRAAGLVKSSAFSYHGIVIWGFMALPLIWMFVRIRYLPFYLVGFLFLYWLICALIVHMLYKRQKMPAILNAWVGTLSVILIFLFTVMMGGTCNDGPWPFGY